MAKPGFSDQRRVDRAARAKRQAHYQALSTGVRREITARFKQMRRSNPRLDWSAFLQQEIGDGLSVQRAP